MFQKGAQKAKDRLYEDVCDSVCVLCISTWLSVTFTCDVSLTDWTQICNYSFVYIKGALCFFLYSLLIFFENQIHPQCWCN